MTLPEDPKARKNMPICTGVIDYFPDAVAAVAECSKVGNDQHNPGQPLHWAKEKSADHADCIARHLVQRGGKDTDGIRHSAKLAWRALALLQTEIEAEALAKPEPALSGKDWLLRYGPCGRIGNVVTANSWITGTKYHGCISEVVDNGNTVVLSYCNGLAKDARVFCDAKTVKPWGLSK